MGDNMITKKKAYEPPIINEITLSPNESIASCAITSGYSVSAVGYRCGWCGGSMGTKEAADEHKNNAHGSVVPDSDIPYCYNVKQNEGDGFFRWEDYNRNGVYDTGDNKQDVHWWNSAISVFAS